MSPSTCSKGTLHTYKGVGEGVGRMLATQTPGGLYENFVEEVGGDNEQRRHGVVRSGFA